MQAFGENLAFRQVCVLEFHRSVSLRCQTLNRHQWHTTPIHLIQVGMQTERYCGFPCPAYFLFFPFHCHFKAQEWDCRPGEGCTIVNWSFERNSEVNGTDNRIQEPLEGLALGVEDERSLWSGRGGGGSGVGQWLGIFGTFFLTENKANSNMLYAHTVKHTSRIAFRTTFASLWRRYLCFLKSLPKLNGLHLTCYQCITVKH